MPVSALTGPVAVLGFGHQGSAHAQNLRDSGVEVVVGARPGRAARERAEALGFPSFDPPEAMRRARVAAVLVADSALPEAWPAIVAAASPETALVFAHGFNLLYGDLAFPERGDIVLVSPTGPGRVLRALYEKGDGLPAYLAVHRDERGEAWALAESYAAAIGCARASLWRTTVAEETEIDLFGEQTVLCGGMNALVTAAFETLAARGYAPEMAYLECVHQLKYLADLLHERGVAGMREGISGTALFGDLTRGPRVVGPEARAAMARAIDEIRSGAFAREWRAEVAAGLPVVREGVRAGASHPMEGARRRALGLEEPRS
jgi:ketol-acid reductoisomerase